jgi:hypothetical protein
MESMIARAGSGLREHASQSALIHARRDDFIAEACSCLYRESMNGRRHA